TAMEIAQELTEMLYVEIPEAVCYAFIPPAIPGLGVTSGVSVEVQDVEGRGTAFLVEEAERLIAALEQEPSIALVTTQFDAGVPQRRLQVDREQALIAGVDLSALYGNLSTLLGGRYIDNFTRFGRLYQTYLQAAPAYRADERSLERYYVRTASGESVPISTLVEVVDTVGTAYVSQFDLYRSISLTITPKSDASTATVMGRTQAVANEVLSDGAVMAWSGLSYQEAKASSRGGWMYGVTLLFVFLALAALYESWGLPLAILLSVPIAVLGALLFMAISHLLDPLFVNDIYMQISLVMLIGLTAKNAILVVEYADRLFFEQGLSLEQATVEAARIRLRPILMTAFSFILGVVPLIFASGVYATARNVMGVALVGGMLFATVLGIFLYPALYYLVARLGHFERRRALKQQQS
ncbi:MAG: efflux RND transporter permease subunit, partial [Alistipes sp.]|nr:efflux RND transporter permease subunit [Alistipes sp.]